MSSKKVIIFDIKGEYAHFRKFNTTTSPLTYSIPTPSAVHGMLGAVLGIEREDSRNRVKEGQPYLRELFSDENCQIAIQPLSEIKRTNIAFNLLIVKSPSDYYNITKGRTQIEFEVLKDPAFRIYLDWDNPRKDELIDRLKRKSLHFTPYLGLSQMTADITFVNESDIELISDKQNFTEFKTAINLSEIQNNQTPVDIEEMSEKIFQVETFPLEMGINRVIKRYGEILVETNGEVIRAIANDKSYRLNEEVNIQFL